jgi:hypothetical protein
MAAYDRKERDYYDCMTEEEQKKFSPFLMIRWGSTVQGSRELQEFYVIAANQLVNRHYFSVNTSQHRKLHWLLNTTVSPDLGVQKHYWIPMQKRVSTSKKHQALRELYPSFKEDEIDLLAAINSQAEIDQLLRDHGHEP